MQLNDFYLSSWCRQNSLHPQLSVVCTMFFRGQDSAEYILGVVSLVFFFVFSLTSYTCGAAYEDRGWVFYKGILLGEHEERFVT